MTYSRKVEILLVDDSSTNIHLLQYALTDYKTLVVDNGRDALAMAREYHPALILLDIQMPGLDGFEVCQILKEKQSTRDIPVIFLTGMSDPQDIAKGFQLGAVDYIIKPFNFPEIRARIATHISLHQIRYDLEAQNKILANTVREQQINAALAHKILTLINGNLPRYIDLTDNLSLFLLSISQPYKLEGGDHCLVKTIDIPAGGKKTILSLKDQSGHSVNCLLRSIVTDFFHDKLLTEYPNADTATIFDRLNGTICQADFFAADDFCTAFTAELHHTDLRLTYLSAGHPPMLLIRQGKVRLLPDKNEGHGNLPLAVLPDITFQAGTIQLQAGDQLILYTDGLNALQKGTPLRQQELIDLVSDIVENHPALTVSELVQQILHRLGALWPDTECKNNLSDDLSLLALEIEDKSTTTANNFCPCDFKNIDELVVAAIKTLPDEITQSAERRMAVREALLNAWRHGNEEISQKAISIRCWQNNDWNIEITDQGRGFYPDSIGTPTIGHNMMSETGRGIFTMRTFCTWLHWQAGGRRVILSMKSHDHRLKP